MSPSRRNLLIVLAIFWLLISWLIVSFRPGLDWTMTLSDTLRIFLPGFLLLFLFVSFERGPAEEHIAVIRKDFAGNYDVFVNRSYLTFPLFYEVVARLPAYSLSFEALVDKIDTRTARLQRIDQVRVGCRYSIVPVQQLPKKPTDRLSRPARDRFIACYKKSKELYELTSEIERDHHVDARDPAFWRILFNLLMGEIIDDKLRDRVWTWPPEVDAANDPGKIKAQPPAPGSTVKLEPENDPYVLSLNRRSLSRQVLESVNTDAAIWSLTVEALFFESIEIDQEIINRKNRNKDNEVTEAQHQGLIDAIAVRARGIAEADVRARTVRRIVEELAEVQKLPALSEDTLRAIVRAAMYSDGEMIWKGVLEKSALPPSTDKSNTPPSPAKTA